MSWFGKKRPTLAAAEADLARVREDARRERGKLAVEIVALANKVHEADQILTNYDYDATLEGLVAALDRGDSSRA